MSSVRVCREKDLLLANFLCPVLFSVFSEDKSSFGNLVDAVKTNYNERFDEIRRKWGGGVMGVKTQATKAKLDKLRMKELSQKM